MFPFLPGKKGLTFVCYIIIPVNMKHQSEKPLAPYSFSRCFNAQCAKAETCLHRLAAVRDTPEYPSIRVINPLCIPADSSKCPYFQSAQKAHVAWGISHLLDDVPYKYLHTLKNRLIAHFGRGNTTASTGKSLTSLPTTKHIFAAYSVSITSRENRPSILTARNIAGRVPQECRGIRDPILSDK